MGIKIEQWEIGDEWDSGIRVPYVDGGCSVVHPEFWVCTRPKGHGGRHTAATTDGTVCAVWHG